MRFFLIIIFGVIGVAVIAVISFYNSFVTRKNRVEEAWSDIEVQMKRRYDLIPNLIETVKGYAVHEKGVFENVTKARALAMGAQTLDEHKNAENSLTGTLKSLFAVAESYPDLKADKNFLALQQELSDSENKIQAARRFYNSNVRDFNTLAESFPGNMIAGYFKFEKKEFFELEEEAAREPVKVAF